MQAREGGCRRTIGLQWRSENLIQLLEFHEKELNVGGAYDCFLTLVALVLEGHVLLQAQLGGGCREEEED